MSDRPTLGSATTRFFTRRVRAAMLKLHTQAVSLKAYADSTLRSSECGCVAGSSSRRCTHCLTALESKSTALELLLLCFHPTTATKTLHTLDHSRPCHGRTAANSSIPAFHVDCSLYVYIYIPFLGTSTLLYCLSHLLYSRCVRVQQHQQTPAVPFKAKRDCNPVAVRSLQVTLKSLQV